MAGQEKWTKAWAGHGYLAPFSREYTVLLRFLHGGKISNEEI